MQACQSDTKWRLWSVLVLPAGGTCIFMTSMTRLPLQTDQNLAKKKRAIELRQMLRRSNATCEQLTLSPPPQIGIEAYIVSPKDKCAVCVSTGLYCLSALKTTTRSIATLVLVFNSLHIVVFLQRGQLHNPKLGMTFTKYR